MTLHAIPTRYAGVQFRSRLEARWAAFFDLCGLKWDYEPFDCAGYIPDFLIRGQVLAEVKPVTWGARSDADTIHAAQDAICGAFPDGKFYWVAILGNGVYEYAPGSALIGKVATRRMSEAWARELWGEHFDPELWNRKNAPRPRDDYGSGTGICTGDPEVQWEWTDLNCDWWQGCYCDVDGCPGGEISLDGQPTLRGRHPVACPSFELLWREAGNRVQWRPSR